jgi:NAD(P)-dependent dehydrogenase (short-subunit alcohol dehydrogenase family)
MAQQQTLTERPQGKKLEGKVALVTGAEQNLGQAFAEALADDGAAVVVHYHSASKEGAAHRVAEGIEAAGGTAVVERADLTKVSEVERLIGSTVDRQGQLDILVNTAGMIVRKPLAEFTEEEYDRLFAVNAKAPFFLMREAAKVMADEGRIVNLVTTVLAITFGTYGGYAGSKAPVEHFTKALAKEIGPRGITVNAVAPGPLNTSFFYPAENPDSIAWLKSMSISGELGEISDVVPLVRFLCSPEARWITAQTIYVNGGLISPIN